MAELIVTDASHVDQASLEDFTLDAAWGADENDFELTVDRLIDAGSYVYFDGGECGGVVDSLKDSLKDGRSTLTYGGRTWHGMLANKILEPDKGKDYLTVSGTASTVIGSLITSSRGAGRPLPSGTERKGTAGWGRPSMLVNCYRKSEKKPPVSRPITADEMPHRIISRTSWPNPPLGLTFHWRKAQAPARIRP